MIGTCDKVDIHLVADNYIDGTTNSTKDVERRGIIYYFTPGNLPVMADNGLCFVIDAYIGETRKRILIDGGWSSEPVLYNMKLMGIDPSTIQTAVLSHGHPDHFGGIYDVLKSIGYTVPLFTHPDAFYPRLITRQGNVSSDVFNRELSLAKLEDAGARVVQVSSPVTLLSGVAYSGQIERTVDFEREVPKNRYAIRDGILQDDDINDDAAIIINVKDKGLVVVLPCGHSGAVNTVKYAQKVTGEEKVYAVVGGFHLGQLGYSSPRVTKTFEALKEMGVKRVVPIHCSGLVGRYAAAQIMPEEYVEIGVASTLHF